MTILSKRPIAIGLYLSVTLVASCGSGKDTEERIDNRAEDLVQDQVEGRQQRREEAGISEAPAPQMTDDSRSATSHPVVAIAEITPTEGSSVAGQVRFRLQGDVVAIAGEITGLSPGGHGIHIHENGDCSAADASSAGGHFDPADDAHGAPEDANDQHHVGDLGNVVADAEGNASLGLTDSELKLSPAPTNVVGRALIIHADADDFTSQPSGDAGDRLACGVIRMVE